MFRRIFLAAIAAGLLSGVLITGIQIFTTTPLILAAEVYETGGHDHASDHAHDGAAAHDHGHSHSHGSDAAGSDAGFPGGGGERLGLTLAANLVTGTGFALILVACFALSGRPVDARNGVLWGLAGFAVFTLAPGLGLPPEVPGSVAAGVLERQTWWVFAAAAAAAGLWLLVFSGRRWAAPVGIALAALPHVVGAPVPAEHGGGGVPPELAAHFASTSMVVNALFWALLGWLAGNFYRRFG
jgi:cobalt transporter subunit CbtA